MLDHVVCPSSPYVDTTDKKADFSMSFKTGFAAAQSATEVRFGPSDATQFSQGAALNPAIISNVRLPLHSSLKDVDE